MDRSVILSASVLSADFSNLSKELKSLEKAGIDRIHIDVMDGHFVPNITVGSDVVKAIRDNTDLPLEVHLMVAPVDNYIETFAEAGADFIIVHIESNAHVHRTLMQIHNLDKKAGIALSPATPVSAIEYCIDLVDLVLVMTVNPGFGGQQFIVSQLTKISKIHQLLEDVDRNVDLAVDGGIALGTASAACSAGANVLVAGTSVFDGGTEESYTRNIQCLKAVRRY